MAEKRRGWYTAFYYLAEHIRLLTDGSINHKQTYSHVGAKAHYINHDDPSIRKSTAASLSRAIHSSKYAKEMRERHASDPRTFESAADEICSGIIAHSPLTNDELFDHLRLRTWPEILKGLGNEREEGRKEVDLARAAREMDIYLMHDIDTITKLSGNETARGSGGRTNLSFVRYGLVPPRQSEMLLSSILHVIAYGHMDEELMRRLCDKTPTSSFPAVAAEDEGTERRACLVRLGDPNAGSIGGTWDLEPDRAYIIGRYTSCDIIEDALNVSRSHCRIAFDGRSWTVQDLGSTNGTKVTDKDGALIHRSGTGLARDGASDGSAGQDGSPIAEPFPLTPGNRVVLADDVEYWFVMLD